MKIEIWQRVAEVEGTIQMAFDVAHTHEPSEHHPVELRLPAEYKEALPMQQYVRMVPVYEKRKA